MKSLFPLSITLFAFGCATKQPAQSFVDGYSLTDEARIQLVGNYQSKEAPNVQLSICEANGSQGEILYVEHSKEDSLQQMVIKLDSMRFDHTGHRSISLVGYDIKHAENVEGLCNSNTEGTITDRELQANTCTGTLRWNGQGFDGFWGEDCGAFSKELIRVNANALTVFSSTWQDTQGQATTAAF